MGHHFHVGMLMKWRHHPSGEQVLPRSNMLIFLIYSNMPRPTMTQSCVLTSVCWIACDAALAVLWLSFASSTFSLMSGRSSFNSSTSLLSSFAASAPSAASITSCSMATRWGEKKKKGKISNIVDTCQAMRIRLHADSCKLHNYFNKS